VRKAALKFSVFGQWCEIGPTGYKSWMPTLAHSNLPTPKSWDEFEDIILTAAKLRWSSQDFSRNGRPGQKQDGVDVYGNDVEGRLIGIQGKNTISGISEDVALEEIKRAEPFLPKLHALYLATSAKRDAKIQKCILTISTNRLRKAVGILFWNDIVQDLAKDDNELFKHYPQLRPAHPKSGPLGSLVCYFDMNDSGCVRPSTSLIRKKGDGNLRQETSSSPTFDSITIVPPPTTLTATGSLGTPVVPSSGTLGTYYRVKVIAENDHIVGCSGRLE
jgi:hypothetical protein